MASLLHELDLPETSLEGKDARQVFSFLQSVLKKSEHLPFDYARHMLQVVAVDHIVQAADVAMIDDKAIRALEDLFVPHARQAARAAKKAPCDMERCILLLYVKDPKELEPEEGMGRIFCERCRMILLHPADLSDGLEKTWPDLPSHVEMRAFNPESDRLSSLVEGLQEPRESSSGQTRVSVVAPFFFIKRDGILMDRHENRRLFANNFAVQDVKIETCKTVLNRVYCHLSGLEASHVESCPFLRETDGIYAVDLGFIPEKYRLDVKHAEEILVRCLKKWLHVVENID